VDWRRQQSANWETAYGWELDETKAKRVQRSSEDVRELSKKRAESTKIDPDLPELRYPEYDLKQLTSMREAIDLELANRGVAVSSPGTKLAPDLDTALDVRLFKALADQTRLSIFKVVLFANQPKSVTEIAIATPNVDISTVGRHLGELAKAGLVTVSRSGTSRLYALACPAVRDKFAEITAFLEQKCPY
jgi:DNA-binding transcriptional ArsR family regulator